jgi:hypothetical protein
MYRHNPGGLSSYLSTCAQIEHFLEYRQIVKEQIEAQLAEYLAQQAKSKPFLEERETSVSAKAF